MKCNKCFNEIPDGNSFCIHCGAKADITDSTQLCPNCGAKLNSKGYFCVKCGAKTAQPDVLKQTGSNLKNRADIQDKKANRISLKAKFIIVLVIFLVVAGAGAVCGFLAAGEGWGIEKLFKKSDIAWLDYSWFDAEAQTELYEDDEKADILPEPTKTEPDEPEIETLEPAAEYNYLAGKWEGMLFGDERAHFIFEFYDENKLKITIPGDNYWNMYDYIFNTGTMIITIIGNEEQNGDYQNEENNGEEYDQEDNDEGETDIVLWYVKPISQYEFYLYTEHIEEWDNEKYEMDYVFTPDGLAFNTDSGYLLTRSF